MTAKEIAEEYCKMTVYWVMGHPDLNMDVVNPVESVMADFGFEPLSVRNAVGNYIMADIQTSNISQLLKVVKSAAVVVYYAGLIEVTRLDWMKYGF